MALFRDGFLILFFIVFARRPWYHKKRFAIPFGILLTLLIGGVILGSVLGSKLADKELYSTGLLFSLHHFIRCKEIEMNTF